MTIYAGTSGFSYPDWRGVFYPEKLAAGRMLDFYAQRLNAVEINGSFRMTPAAATLAGWAARVPAGFRFCFKAHRGLTYSAAAFPKLELAADLGARLAAAGAALGPVLVQLPPTFKLDHGLLDAILEALALPAAVEVRSEEWLGPQTEAVVARRGAALVVTDQEKWPLAPEADTARFAYYRLRRDYEPAELEVWARRLIERVRGGGAEDVHVFFKHEPPAPGRAQRVLEVAAENGLPWMPPRS